MAYFVIICVCLLSSVIGAICGIGGGVIIKPVLDAVGMMPVSTVSFLSGCTVLSMSIVSLSKNMKSKHDFVFDKMFATVLAMGAVVGGLLGKALFQKILNFFPDSNRVGAVQAGVLLVITLGTLIYTMRKNTIHTHTVRSKTVIFIIGMLLGIMSSFLGIGGGPINLVILFYFFSMGTKEAAMYSIYVIMFSQIASLISTIVQGNVPGFDIVVLLLMVLCGISGGLIGNVFNKKLTNEKVDKLFIGVMLVIICINVYNIFRYI